MLTFLIGENSFAVDKDLQEIISQFDGSAEHIDGPELELRQLPDLLMGVSLFSEKRLVIIRNLSQNKYVWDKFSDWLDRISGDIHLVLVEAKVDKRTKTYKALTKVADTREYKPWTERDVAQAEKWLRNRADELGVNLGLKQARLLVKRIGVDQWQLAHALDKLSVLDSITEEIILDVIEPNPSENVFELFEIALKGDIERVKSMIDTLSLHEDPYKLFGLLSSQAFQMAVLAVSRDGDNVAGDLGAHPFVLSRLRPYVLERGVRGVGKIVDAFVKADVSMKTSSTDPWLVIERALFSVVSTK